MAQWEYVEALKCVQLSLDDQQYMLQLSFSDQQLLAMKLYSGNEYCIMIEESRYAECKLKTLNDVQQYFTAIAAKQEKQLQEQKRLEEESEQKKERKAEIDCIKNKVSFVWLNSDKCKDFCKKHKVGLWLANLPDWMIAFPALMLFFSSIIISEYGIILVTRSQFIMAGWLCIAFGLVIVISFGYLVVYSFLLRNSYIKTHINLLLKSTLTQHVKKLFSQKK